MIRSLLALSLFLLLPAQSQGQDSRLVKCRVVLFERTSKDPADIFAYGKMEGEFIRNRLSVTVETPAVEYTVPASGKIVFLASGDPKSPVIATTTIPVGMDSAYLFFVPDPKPDDAILYQVMAFEDSERTIPVGGAFVCNLNKQDARVSLGEHKYQVPSGKIAILPQPKNKDEFDQAQFDVAYFDTKDWLPIKSGLQRCGERDRYLMFIHQGTRGAPVIKTYSRAVPFRTAP